jgi:hypothetical protein
MQVLREISAQSADSTAATSQAIVKLGDLATALRKSISGFRLPASDTISGTALSGTAISATAVSGMTAGTGTQRSSSGAMNPPSGVFSSPKVKVLGS